MAGEMVIERSYARQPFSFLEEISPEERDGGHLR